MAIKSTNLELNLTPNSAEGTTGFTDWRRKIDSDDESSNMQKIDKVIGEHTGNKNNPHGTTAGQVGAISSSEKGAANGVPTLGSDKKVPKSQLPQLGLYPRITVTGPTTGSTVTATKDETVITGVESPTGTWAIDIPDYGDWKIEAIRDTQYTKQIVSVQIVQNYTIELVYIDPVFSNNTWGQIIQAADTNKIPDSWQLKDKKPLTLKDGRTINVEISGKNREELVGGGTASLVFGFADCLEYKRMNATNTNVGGWRDSELRAYCNGDLYNQFPDDLRGAIKKAIKKSSAGNQSTSIITTEDYLWLYSATEVFPSPFSSYSPGGEGELYPIFTDDISRIKNLNGSPQCWWLRSPYVGTDTNFCRVSTGGAINNNSATNAYGVVLGFAI